jgi:hypothetical protein
MTTGEQQYKLAEQNVLMVALTNDKYVTAFKKKCFKN